MSREFIQAIQLHIAELWTAKLKPRLGTRGEGYLSTAHKRLDSLDRWQIVVATILATLLIVQLLVLIKDSLQSFQDKGELPLHLN